MIESLQNISWNQRGCKNANSCWNENKSNRELGTSFINDKYELSKLSTFYLLQSISMAIQRGNAICVTTWVKDTSSGLEGLFNFQVHEAEELWRKNIYIYTKYLSY